MISQQSVMIAKLLTPQEDMRNKDKTYGSKSTPIDIKDDTPYKFKCKGCNFEAVSLKMLDNHIVANHRQVHCPMCNYSN